jgi:hypothetical protein
MTASTTSQNRHSLASILTLLAGLAACAGQDGPAAHDWKVVHDTAGDTVIVRTVSGSVWGDTARLVADLTIGTFDGPDEYMFGQLRSLAVAPDGTIYAYDSHAKALRKYAPDGTYVAKLGREGGGPGEYNRPDGGLAVLSDGRVVIRDPGNARLTVYGADGEFLDTWRIRGNFNTSRRMYLDGADNVYPMILLDPAADVTDWTYGLVTVSSSGEIGDTIAAPVYDYEPPSLVARREGSTSMNSVPFTPDQEWTYSPLGYMVGALATSYAIDLFLAPDRVLRIERASWEPVPVLAAEKAEREERATANMRNTQPNWKWNGPPIPDTKPPFSGVSVGERGRIWVRLHQEAYQIEDDTDPADLEPNAMPPQTWFEPVAFDVFEPDGRYLGMVRGPEGFATWPYPVMRGDTIWAVQEDELEVQYIVRFIITHEVEATN